jgi:hypothetical protein
MSKNFLKIATVAALTSLEILTFSYAANAKLATNGTSLNGIRTNGIRANGVKQNGLNSEKTGLALSSSKFTTIRVEGGRLVGVGK